MDERKLVLPLDLQFFAEGDEVDNPTQTTEPTQPQQPQVDNGKKFTQEDLNRINIKGKNDELKRILKATGFETEEALINHLAKVKDYDDKASKVAEYEAKAVKENYLTEIRKNNVADEYIETIYVAVAPQENEKVEEYNKRVATYMETHKALLKVDTSNKFFNTNIGYQGNQYAGNQSLSIANAIKQKQGIK
jgi:DNA-directed RNA polymerase beta subunit